MFSKRFWTILLVGIGIVLFVIGFFFHQKEAFPLYRFVSAVIPLAYMCMMLVFIGRKSAKWLLVFFTLYALSRLTTIFYEIDYMASVFLILNSFAFLCLVWYAFRQIDLTTMNVLFKVIFAIVVLVNGYFVYQLLVFVRGGLLSEAHYINMLFNGACSIVMALAALLYNHQSGTRASMYFLIAVLLIIFSQIFLTLGYYNLGYDNNISIHIARTLLILSCLMFVKHNIAFVTPSKNSQYSL
jgi:hypothetical protein